jgi:ribosomal protein L17
MAIRSLQPALAAKRQEEAARRIARGFRQLRAAHQKSILHLIEALAAEYPRRAGGKNG